MELPNILSKGPEELNPEEVKFLRENAANLSDADAERFAIVLQDEGEPVAEAEAPKPEKIIWATEKRRVGDLLPWDKNPRVLTTEQAKILKASLNVFGLVEIPVINSDNTIIAGHQRVGLLQKQDPEQIIEVRVPSRPLTPDEFARYNLTSNRNTGNWDWDMLANNFSEDIMRLAGFNDVDLQGILPDLSVDNNPVPKDLETYNEGLIKQVVLYFSAKQYDDIYPRIISAVEKAGVEDVTALFIKLLHDYEGPDNPEAGS